MLHGEVLYRDLFQFNLPGTESLYYVLFRCFGVKLWPANLILCIALLTTAVLVYSLSRLVLRGPIALLPSAAYLVICVRSNLDGSHHWYSTLLVLLSVNLVARARDIRWNILAGISLGLASVFTSTRGISIGAGIALFFIWKLRNPRRAVGVCAALLVPIAVVLAVVLAWGAMAAGPRTLYESIVAFPAHFYSAGYSNGPMTFFDQWTAMPPVQLHSILYLAPWLAINVTVPLTFLVFALNYFRSKAENRSNSRRNETLVLLAFAGTFAFLAVASAPSMPRLNCSAAFAYILLAVMLQDGGHRKLMRGVLIGVSCVGLVELTSAVIRPVYVLHIPRGSIACVNREEYKIASWVASNAHPGDRLFGASNLNLILGMKNPSRLPWVEPDDYTRPEQIADLVKALQYKPTRFVIWFDYLDQIHGTGDHLQPLRAYLRDHYTLAQRYDDGTQILVMNSPASCMK